MPRIKKVTYSKPVTIIRWDDDTITKAFCDEVDNYDELTGFLMCIIKKMVPAKEMRKLFSKYVYGDNPKYIKRIVPKKERKKFDDGTIFLNNLMCPPLTLLDEEKLPKIKFDDTPIQCIATLKDDSGIEDFIKALDELTSLFDDED